MYGMSFGAAVAGLLIGHMLFPSCNQQHESSEDMIPDHRMKPQVQNTLAVTRVLTDNDRSHLVNFHDFDGGKLTGLRVTALKDNNTTVQRHRATI